MNDFEASSVIIIQRGDAWGDGIVDDFESKYNGQILRKIRYPGETIEFKHQLEIAEAAFTEYNETEKPNMLLVTFSEASYILNDAKYYPVLLNTTWFGTDSIADDRSILEEAGEYASQVKLISPKISVNQENVDYLEINQLYMEKFGSDMDFYQANVYDCCWLMAHCIIDLNTTDGGAIQSSILEVASKHQGITGNLSLDSNGDREIASYALYGYFNVNGTYVSEKCGFYQQDTDQIIWENNYLYLESRN
jgi:ABC-type branched-subunit amino acid transport system substrate-binding protein